MELTPFCCGEALVLFLVSLLIFVGIYEAMQTIMMANDTSPAIVADGYTLSLITILTGLFYLWFPQLYGWYYNGNIKKPFPLLMAD